MKGRRQDHRKASTASMCKSTNLASLLWPPYSQTKRFKLYRRTHSTFTSGKTNFKKLDFNINWAKCYKKATTKCRLPHDNPLQWSIPTEVRLHLSQEQPSLPPPNLLNISFLLPTRQNSRTRRTTIPSKVTHQSQRHCLLSATLF